MKPSVSHSSMMTQTSADQPTNTVNRRDQNRAAGTSIGTMRKRSSLGASSSSPMATANRTAIKTITRLKTISRRAGSQLRPSQGTSPPSRKAPIVPKASAKRAAMTRRRSLTVSIGSVSRRPRALLVIFRNSHSAPEPNAAKMARLRKAWASPARRRVATKYGSPKMPRLRRTWPLPESGSMAVTRSRARSNSIGRSGMAPARARIWLWIAPAPEFT